LEIDVGVEIQVEERQGTGIIDDLSRVEQRLLAYAFNAVGSKEVSSIALSFLPPWIIEKAVETERQNNMNVVEETSYASRSPRQSFVYSQLF
jgi:hypothetical protein